MRTQAMSSSSHCSNPFNADEAAWLRLLCARWQPAVPLIMNQYVFVKGIIAPPPDAIVTHHLQAFAPGPRMRPHNRIPNRRIPVPLGLRQRKRPLACAPIFLLDQAAPGALELGYRVAKVLGVRRDMRKP